MVARGGSRAIGKAVCGWIAAIALLVPGAALAQQQVNKVTPSGNAATDLANINQAILNAETWESSHPATLVYVELEAGTFYLNDSAESASCNPNNATKPTYCITINGASYLVFEGSVDASGDPTTQIEMVDPNAGFLQVWSSTNIRVTNLIIDYQTPPFIQGTIKDVHLDAAQPYFDVNVDSGYQNFSNSLYQCHDQPVTTPKCTGVPVTHYCVRSSDFLSLVQPGNPPRIKPNTPNFMKVCAYDTATDTPVCTPPSSPSADLYEFASQNADGSWRIYYNNQPGNHNPNWNLANNGASYIAAGDRFVFIARTGNDDINVRANSAAQGDPNNPNAVVVRNVTVHAAPGLVAGFQGNYGPLIVNGLDVSTNGDRLISSNADGTHFENDRGPITMVNSSFQGIADDAYSSFSVRMNIDDNPSNTPPIVTGAGGSFTVCLPRQLEVGDQLQIVDNSGASTEGTIRGGPSALSTITAITPSVCSASPTLASPTPGLAACTITMNSVPAGASPGDIVYLYNGAGGTGSPSANVYDNTFGSHRGHGILMDSPNGAVRNNQFTDLNLGGVMVGPTNGTGGEGPIPSGVSVHNNSFTGEDIQAGQEMTDGNGNEEWCNWDSTTQCNPVAPTSYEGQIEVSAGPSNAKYYVDGPSNVNIYSNSFANPTTPSIIVGVGQNVTLNNNTVTSGSTVARIPGPSILLCNSDPSEGATLTVPNFTLTTAGPDTNAAVEIGSGVSPAPNYQSWTIHSGSTPPVQLDVTPCTTTQQ